MQFTDGVVIAIQSRGFRIATKWGNQQDVVTMTRGADLDVAVGDQVHILGGVDPQGRFATSSISRTLANGEVQDVPDARRKSRAAPTRQSVQAAASSHPADFFVELKEFSAPLPPPHNRRRFIVIGPRPRGVVRVDTGDPSVEWTETFPLSDGHLDWLLGRLKEHGLFESAWLMRREMPVGSGGEQLTVIADGRTVVVPAFVTPEREMAARAMFDLVRALVPADLQERVDARAQKQARKHSNDRDGANASSSSRFFAGLLSNLRPPRNTSVTAPQPPAAPVPCPRCQTPNQPEVRFCGSCGAPMQGSASQQHAGPPPPPHAPPQMPPSPPPNVNRGISFGSGGGSGAQAALNADTSTAFNVALQAIGASGGQVLLQSPPQSVRFSMTKKDFMNTGGMKVKYIGDVVIMPMGPRQSSVRVECKAENLTPVIGLTIGATIFGAILNLQTAILFIIIGGLAVAWQLYNVNGSIPKAMGEKMLLDIQMAAQSGASAPYPPPSPGFSPPPPPPPQGFAPPPPPPPPPVAPMEAPAQPQPNSVVADMRNLNELRDMGVLTPDEYEVKKAEILKRL